MKEGLDAHIGESGNKLSVGQKQRLSLAHMFLLDPDIIILDEPTSALDNESEKVITDTILALRGKKTIIIIAHRLSTIKHSDRIIVLDKGKLVEEGSREELLAREGKFKHLLELQEF